MNRNVLLLFKVNDFIRAITLRLGSPVKQYEIMVKNKLKHIKIDIFLKAKYCFDSVEQKEFDQRTSLMKRFRFWLQRSTTLLAFKLYGYYYSFVSLFKTPVIPDEVMLL